MNPLIKVADMAGASGFLRIFLKHKVTGELVGVPGGDNLIVTLGRQRILQSLYATSSTVDPIYELRVGSGGTIDPAGQYPLDTSKSQTDLNARIAGIAVVLEVVEDLDNLAVTFIADVDTADANNLIISEAGLFTKSGTLFSVKNFPGIPKSAEFTVHFEWTIRTTG